MTPEKTRKESNWKQKEEPIEWKKIGTRPNWCKKDQTALAKQKADLAGARRSRPDCFNKRIRT